MNLKESGSNLSKGRHVYFSARNVLYILTINILQVEAKCDIIPDCSKAG